MRGLVICGCLGLSRLVAQVGDASLTVEVRDITGARIPGTKAELKSESSDRVYGIAPDDSRTYRFAGLPADDYTLKLFKPGFKSLTVKSIRLSDGEQRLMPPLELDASLPGCGDEAVLDYLRFLPEGSRVGNLGGGVRVYPAVGKSLPVAGADVSLTSRGIVRRVTKTDSLGEFMFKTLSPGSFSIRVSRAGFYPQEERGHKVKAQEGRELIYYSIFIERCPHGNCDPKLRPTKPLGFCE